jgi:hypothetical protein
LCCFDLPRSACADAADQVIPNREATRDATVGLTLTQGRNDRADLIRRKPSVAISLAALITRPRTAALGFIAHVVGVCAEFEVRWIAARRIIAAVPNHKLGRITSVRQRPSYAVRSNGNAAELQAAIAALLASTRPKPARVGRSRRNTRPEIICTRPRLRAAQEPRKRQRRIVFPTLIWLRQSARDSAELRRDGSRLRQLTALISGRNVYPTQGATGHKLPRVSGSLRLC